MSQGEGYHLHFSITEASLHLSKEPHSLQMPHENQGSCLGQICSGNMYIS